MPQLLPSSKGMCQSYDCGGELDFPVHYYTCCNIDVEACQGVTFDGASSGNYCGRNGKNEGGGCALGEEFGCRGCAGAISCKNFCDNYAVSVIPQIGLTLCFNWQSCFEHCCRDPDGPSGGVDGWIKVSVCTENSLRRLRGDWGQCNTCTAVIGDRLDPQCPFAECGPEGEGDPHFKVSTRTCDVHSGASDSDPIPPSILCGTDLDRKMVWYVPRYSLS
jgi:hypothetical protein